METKRLRLSLVLLVFLALSGFLIWRYALGSGFIGEFSIGLGSWYKKIPLPSSSTPPTTVPQNSPFTISVVPLWSSWDSRGIAMAKVMPRTFYVILNNVSKEPQAAFNEWSSWGYYAVHFEFMATDGRKFVISKKPTGFTKNNPSTFVILPGESMVYAISLGDDWDAVPALPIADETPMRVALKAVYKIDASTEATQQRVWTGRLESKNYQFELRHWEVPAGRHPDR